MNIKKFADQWIDYRLAVGAIKPASARNYRIMLKPLLKNYGGKSKITVTELKSFVMSDVADNGVKAARQRFVIAKAMMAAALKDGLINVNPFDQVEKPKARAEAPRGTLDSEQVRSLHSHSYSLGQTGLAIRIAISTGMRRGELAALRWGDVDHRVIHVRHTATRSEAGIEIDSPKTSAAIRSISIPASLSEELRQCAGAPEAFVLDGVHPETLSSRVNKHLPDGFTIHDLRHAHATALLAAGIPVKAVSCRLGHADVMTTMRVYAHAMPRDEDAAVEAIDAIVGVPVKAVA